eukprot:ANDGO_04821.mRNA.1 hypothetical protein SDRG_07645
MMKMVMMTTTMKRMEYRFLCWFVVCVCLSPSLLCSSQIVTEYLPLPTPTYSTYTVDFTLVPATPADSLNTQVDAYGACACDLTFTQCDTNCCCDLDCSTQQKALFTGCVPEGPSESTLRTCIRKDLVHETNLPENAGFTAQDTASELLCIRYDNSPSKGWFYSAPTFLSSTQVNDLYSRSASATTSTFEEADQSAATITGSSSTQYSVGSPLVAFRSSLPYSNGFFGLPGPGLDGFCNANAQYARYLTSKQGTSCVVKWDGTATTTCALLVAAAPTLAQSWWTSSTLAIGVNPSVTLASAASSFVTPTTNEWVVASTSAGYSWTVSTSAASFVDPVSSGSVCQNIVSEVTYLVSHDGAGVITGVQVSIVVDAVNPLRGAWAQKTSVSFLRASTAVAQSRVRSGNAGYEPGHRILGGVLATSGSLTAVTEDSRGFLITGPASSGACVKENTPVGYGGDMIIQCTKMYANQAALSTECTTMPVPVELASLSQWYIAKYGTANANNVSDWIQVSMPATPTATPTWDNTYKVCKGMIVGLRVRFARTFAGRLDNPQELITGVSVSYVTDLVYWPPEVSSTASYGVRFRSVVSFVDQASDVSLVVPSTPPILPRLSDDVLYPFSIDVNSYAAFSVSSTLAVLAILLLISVLFDS